MTQNTPALSLPLIQPSQAQKHVTHNEALMRLDALVQPVALNRSDTNPPLDPVAGETYIVPDDATGLWSGQAQKLANYDGVSWNFLAAHPGWRIFVLSEMQTVVWDGNTWIGENRSLQNQSGLGIGAEFDTTNRLSVASDASLLSHNGAGHQVKINKANATDTASLLFQTGFASRAEMGTTGDDAFAVKVTEDGSTWHSALRFDPTTGHASGEAVQATREDITAGRLMRADYGYGPGNILGPVSQNGGVPGGSVFENGTTSDGNYTRFADGTQICQADLVLDYQSAALCSADWRFPEGFAPASAPQVLGMLNNDDLSVTAPSITAAQITSVTVSSLSKISVTVQIHTLDGHSFTTGESVMVSAIAFGRWF